MAKKRDEEPEEERGIIEEIFDVDEDDDGEEVEVEAEEIEVEDRQAPTATPGAVEVVDVDPSGEIADALETISRGYSTQKAEMEELRERMDRTNRILEKMGWRV